MKKINTNLKSVEVENTMRLFREILEEGKYNLNKLINGTTLVIEEGESQKLGDLINQLIEKVLPIVKVSDEIDDFWKMFLKDEQYEKNNLFVEWLKGYINSLVKPYKEAKFIRNIQLTEFKDITRFCFENMILQDIGKEKVQEQRTEEIFILRKIFLTFIDMVIGKNYAKDNAFDTMEQIFGLCKEKSEVWWELVKKNEDRLWKIVMMMKCNRIEEKLNYVLNELEDTAIPIVR